MKTKLIKLILCCTVVLYSNATFGQTALLWVGDDATDGDAALIAYLNGVGYITTVVSPDDFKASYTTADAYSAFDVIFISEIVGSGDVVAFATAGFPIPCVTTEGYAVRTNRWAFITDDENQFHQSESGEQRTDGVKTLKINNGDHYITAFYEQDDLVDWTTAAIDDLGVTGCKLNENINGAVKLATYTDEAMSEFPTLWAIPDGSLIQSSSTTIPVKIVIFGVIAPGLGTTATDDFNKIVQRSLEWVTDNLNAVEDISYKSQTELSAVPNPTTGIVDISFTLNTAGIVQLNIYDITGKNIETIESDYLNAGPNTIRLDISDKANAQYIINIVTENNILTGKICKN